MFENPVSKVQTMLEAMHRLNIVPECEYVPCLCSLFPSVIFAYTPAVACLRSLCGHCNRESINLGCRCFDTGIVRSIKLYQDVGLLPLHAPVNVSFVMGVASGMPARSDLLPILLSEIQANVQWQVIAIGRRDIWDLHRRAIELGG